MANTVRAMHYDFKQKLNKIDSQQYRNLKVPEIDWKLNEALYLFVKMIAEPRTSLVMGFERNQRTIDDIRALVIPAKEINTETFKTNVVKAALPSDYLFHVRSKSVCTKEECTVEIPNIVEKHGEDFENDVFAKSSFEWREVNALFVGNNMHLFSDGTFAISKLLLDYIKKPVYFHTAIDAAGGKYKLPDGETLLEDYQNCELPDALHGEIVDLAVLITTGDLISDYQAKYSKVQITN